MRFFLNTHASLMNDPFLKAFLESPRHEELFRTAVCQPAPAHQLALDDAFRTYYANKQFLNYLSTTLYWKAVHYDQQRRRHSSRFPLVPDGSFFPMAGNESTENKAIERIYPLLEERLSYPALKQAYKQLTFRQKTVLHHIYGEGLLFYETAAILGITQQGVSSVHKQALQKLQSVWKEQGK